jgi:hypothetical protein
LFEVPAFPDPSTQPAQRAAELKRCFSGLGGIRSQVTICTWGQLGEVVTDCPGLWPRGTTTDKALWRRVGPAAR